LKDFDRPERLFQPIISGLASDFPPLRAIDQQPPLSGTVTIVLTEGRRMMRLLKELPHEHFETLLNEYHRLVTGVLARAGGRGVETAGDSVAAGFATAREAVLAAAAAQRAVTTHEWPYVEGVAMSVGVHTSEAGIGFGCPAIRRCEELCDAAEGGQIFLSRATASLLEDEISATS
jgi:class 3 adenylate cyclase